jgi:hypothetical protein
MYFYVKNSYVFVFLCFRECSNIIIPFLITNFNYCVCIIGVLQNNTTVWFFSRLFFPSELLETPFFQGLAVSPRNEPTRSSKTTWYPTQDLSQLKSCICRAHGQTLADRPHLKLWRSLLSAVLFARVPWKRDKAVMPSSLTFLGNECLTKAGVARIKDCLIIFGLPCGLPYPFFSE